MTEAPHERRSNVLASFSVRCCWQSFWRRTWSDEGGVGGKAGPAFDASTSDSTIDVLEFAARMWRGAAVMMVLQEMELGYQIELSGGELADLAGFANDAEEQQRFSEDDIPDMIKDWSVDEIYEELDQMAQ